MLYLSYAFKLFFWTLSVFWDSHNEYVGQPDSITQISEALYTIFFNVFISVPQIDHFHCLSFRFIHSFKYTFEFLWWIISYCNFQLQILFFSSLVFIFFINIFILFINCFIETNHGHFWESVSSPLRWGIPFPIELTDRQMWQCRENSIDTSEHNHNPLYILYINIGSIPTQFYVRGRL